jgi:hypothetical protein
LSPQRETSFCAIMHFTVRMGWNVPRVTYKGYRTGESRSVVADYLGDESRAADLHNDFAALTIRRFTADWKLSASNIDKALTEVETLRARLRIALARG